ncbi:unnamed protein product [Paramecium sonneborni]|uniref:Transmembrane protein n=1 Tax=Paramecium sonneborni TaxID=65129 RepID=A0A8S1NMH8_9CILI|nr:unnamed protein product [Paramecium sonneborni]
MLCKFLRKIDMFGQPVSLKFNGHSKHQTEVGGLASIATITVVFLFFSSNIISFINKGELSAIVVNNFEEIPQFISLSGERTLAVGFNNISQSTYFNVTLQQITIENQIITNKTLITIGKCRPEQFQIASADSLQTYQTDHFLCLEQNQYLYFGQNDSKKYEVHLIISKCQNNQSSCIPDQNLEDQIFNVQLIFQNQVVNPMEVSEQYIQTFLDDTYSIKFVPNTFSKEQELLITQYDLNNDESIIYENVHQSQAYAVDSRDSKQVVNIDNDVYASFIFKKNKLKYTVNRSYQKITDLLARLGGFLKISFFILGFVIQIYNRLQLYLILANKIYEFSFDTIKQREYQEQQFEALNSAIQCKMSKTNILNINEEGSQQKLPISRILQKNNSIKSKQNSFSMLPFSSQNLPLFINDTNKKQIVTEEECIISANLIDHHIQLAKKFNCSCGLDYFQKQITKIINRSQPLNLTIRIFLNHLFCSKLFRSNIHVKLYRKSMKEISNHLDVYYILQKLEELNKLKSILLSNQQLLVFNFTPKQMIAPDKNELKFNRNFLEEKARIRHTTLLSEPQNTPTKILQPKKRASEENENIIYQRIYNAYDDILKQYEGENPKQEHDINKQLIEKLGAELKSIFRASKIIDFSQLQSSKQSRKSNRRHAQFDNEIQSQINQNIKQFFNQFSQINIYGKTITIIFLALLTIEFFRIQNIRNNGQKNKNKLRIVLLKNMSKMEKLNLLFNIAQGDLTKGTFNKFNKLYSISLMNEQKESVCNILWENPKKDYCSFQQVQNMGPLLFNIFDKKISEMSDFWRTHIIPSKLKYGILSYLAFNFIIPQLSSSGAFEIFINDQLIHSKTNSGQMPSIDTLFRL